jgi:hypothetical protein
MREIDMVLGPIEQHESTAFTVGLNNIYTFDDLLMVEMFLPDFSGYPGDPDI